MPISKAEAIATVTERLEKEYEGLCALIDSKIDAMEDVTSTVSVSIMGRTPATLKRVIEVYTSPPFDWEAEVVPDQREGDDWLYLS